MITTLEHNRLLALFLILILPFQLIGQEQKLNASDGGATDLLGVSSAVSADGNYIIVGADGKDDVGSNSGAAYVYFNNSGTWQQQAKLISLDQNSEDQFGWRVAISDNGEYAIVGAKEDDEGASNGGAAYIFVRSGTSWSQQFKLIPSDPGSDDEFGYSVGINGVGDIAVVGAVFEDENGTDSGSAYIFSRTVTTWTQQFKLTASDGSNDDEFGYSAGINSTGDYVIIGARLDDDGGSASGSAYIFTGSGMSWTQDEKLTALDATSGDEFGVSVSIGSSYAIVGSWLDDDSGTDNGSAYIFNLNMGNWTQATKLLATDRVSEDYFGWSVYLNRAETAVMIGAWGDDDNGAESGSAYVFTGSGSSWNQVAKVTASDGAAGDEYGRSVSIDNTQSFGVVGAIEDDDDGNMSGAAYAYGASSLPVELIGFNASLLKKEKAVLLEWSTAQELNNRGFEIQHYIDQNNWEKIDFIDGQGTSSNFNDYKFQHKSPGIGTNYYRLKQIDFDGTFEYSEVVSVEVGGYEEDISIFPNPTKDKLTIHLPKLMEKSGLITLYDTKGQLIKNYFSNAQTINLSLIDLIPGIYFIQIQLDDKISTHKFVKY